MWERIFRATNNSVGRNKHNITFDNELRKVFYSNLIWIKEIIITIPLTESMNAVDTSEEGTPNKLNEAIIDSDNDKEEDTCFLIDSASNRNNISSNN